MPNVQYDGDLKRMLRNLALSSPAAFDGFVHKYRTVPFGKSNFVDGEPYYHIDIDFIEVYASIAACDEAVAIQTLELPFLRTVTNFGDELHDLSALALKSLERLARSDLDGVRRVLSSPELSDEVTRGQRALVVLLALEQEDAAAAAAIRGIPWVPGTLTHTKESDLPHSYKINRNHFPEFSIARLANLAKTSPDTFRALMDKPWLRDSYSTVKYEALEDIAAIASYDSAVSAQLVAMPFLETLAERDDPAADVLDILKDIFLLPPGSSDPENWLEVSLGDFLSSPQLRGGITRDNLGTVALLDIKLRNPVLGKKVESLPWIQDGVAPSEQAAAMSFQRVALHAHPFLRDVDASSAPVLDAMVSKPWMQDGLTPRELELFDDITHHLGLMLVSPNHEFELQLLEMPVLDTIDLLDYHLVRALTLNFEPLQDDFLVHPWIQGTITDENANRALALAVLSGQTRSLPDPSQLAWQERPITLPLAGEVILSVFGQLGPSTDETVAETMDLLEHAVRTQEAFMGVAFPNPFAMITIEGGFRRGGGHTRLDLPWHQQSAFRNDYQSRSGPLVLEPVTAMDKRGWREFPGSHFRKGDERYPTPGTGGVLCMGQQPG